MVLFMVLCGICGGALSAMAAGMAGSGLWTMVLAYTGGGTLAALMAAGAGLLGPRLHRAKVRPPAPRAPSIRRA